MPLCANFCHYFYNRLLNILGDQMIKFGSSLAVSQLICCPLLIAINRPHQKVKC